MKNLNTQLIVSGIITILLSVGIIYLVYTVFRIDTDFKIYSSQQQTINFINNQLKAAQNAPTTNSSSSK